ncbi:hypothetical protein SPRG_17528 [Saprolegnia parasitica CBS 223.65]|uniref:Uncharacterized protein n=1 Tax=Saprolegnia parasitica (strain CBS 223.65) TaxID=695850 RepID=A0A067BJY8_SAPPC|nr:hypothetical protein SPRG_17528 [Saprolegnia parasitica CBS 223.65]KDO17050.1 hypothetical protein SPRG_17528 [Saprolegnia parasitica CBS 223.65]|eukprot:XP_012212242.1 hypothetical protein SPRG_17528 [Saprolegnia parasitica CBS 223.65]
MVRVTVPELFAVHSWMQSIDTTFDATDILMMLDDFQGDFSIQAAGVPSTATTNKHNAADAHAAAVRSVYYCKVQTTQTVLNAATEVIKDDKIRVSRIEATRRASALFVQIQESNLMRAQKKSKELVAHCLEFQARHPIATAGAY